MPRPGVDVVITEGAPSAGAILDTSQGFMVGVAERGPVDSPAALRSLRAYERLCGPRSGGVTAHDSVRAFFSERGGTLYFLRLVGTGAVAASATVGVLKADALSPGTWGNSVAVGIEADTGLLAEALKLDAKSAKKGSKSTRADDDDDENGNGNGSNGHGALPLLRVVVRSGTGAAGSRAVVERSGLMTTAEEAVGWARQFSAYVRLSADNLTADLAAVAAASLTGGTGGAAVTPAVVGDTLDHFDYALGPGQVFYPGATDAATHRVILDHCDRFRRVALLDLAYADDVTMAADVMSLYAAPGARFGAAFAPQLVYPGPAPGTTVLMPYSAVQAGVIARADRSSGNPNEPAAGVNGESLAARGLARDFDDDTREELNELGVTLAVVRNQRVRTYGSRTCAGPDNTLWQWFGGSRVVMAVAHECDDTAEQFVHKQIDPQRRLFLGLQSALTGVVDRYFAMGALYGETAEDAYDVDTSEAVNTPETIAAGEIHAIVRLATSPPGEWVVIEIHKLSSLAA